MSKFNRGTVRPAASGPLVAQAKPTGPTHEGAPGFAHDAKTELFLLAVSNMVGEDTFYEKAAGRDDRFAGLVGRVAVDDAGWLLAFITWLRAEGNMRSASVVAAAEAVHARLAAARGTHASDEMFNAVANRAIIAAALQRADEPGELIAYWLRRFGRPIPIAVKRGVADALVRLYDERSLLKYDSTDSAVRFGDVVDLVQPAYHRPQVRGTWRYDLFGHAIDRRHARDKPIAESLPMLRARAELMRLPVAQRRTAVLADGGVRRLADAGVTWEALAGWIESPMDAGMWEAVIPSMGYMALLRNVRNFDEAGVSDEVAGAIAQRLADPAQVARSRQFPYRFLAAYEQAPSLRWGHALDQALNHSLANVPALPGRSLVLVDTSASMTGRAFSARSKMTPAKAAAVFGVVLAARGEADLVGFADGTFEHVVPRGASVLREVDRFVGRTGEVGHGTQIATSIRARFRGHDRVFVISDMQTMDAGTTSALPADVPLYGFNLGGYKHTAFPAGAVPNRHELGGLTDATFRIIPLLEAGQRASWPWSS
jgi:hypothetical protein